MWFAHWLLWQPQSLWRPSPWQRDFTALLRDDIVRRGCQTWCIRSPWQRHSNAMKHAAFVLGKNLGLHWLCLFAEETGCIAHVSSLGRDTAMQSQSLQKLLCWQGHFTALWRDDAVRRGNSMWCMWLLSWQRHCS